MLINIKEKIFRKNVFEKKKVTAFEQLRPVEHLLHQFK